MSALITVITVLISVAGYLATGIWLVARPHIPRAMERKRRAFPSLFRHSDEVAAWRKEAAWEALAVGLVWPIYLVFRALDLAVRRLDASAPLAPYEVKQREAQLRRELNQRNERIAQLERDLGIGQKKTR